MLRRFASLRTHSLHRTTASLRGTATSTLPLVFNTRNARAPALSDLDTRLLSPVTEVSIEATMGPIKGSCTGSYDTMARMHDTVILCEDKEGRVKLAAVHGPFFVKGLHTLALEGYSSTPLAPIHQPSTGYQTAYVSKKTLKTLPRFDHLQQKVANIIMVGDVPNGQAVIKEAVQGFQETLCMEPCVRQAFAQSILCAVDPANANVEPLTAFHFTNAQSVLPIELVLEDYARTLPEKSYTDAIYMERGDYAEIFELWINDDDVKNRIKDWEQKVCSKDYEHIQKSGTLTDHGPRFTMDRGHERTVESGAPLGIWNMGKDNDGLMTLDAVVIGGPTFLHLCKTSELLSGGYPIEKMMPTEGWGPGKYNPKTQKIDPAIPIFPRDLIGDFVRDELTDQLYRKQSNMWGGVQWNPHKGLDVSTKDFYWRDCLACAQNRRVAGAIHIPRGDALQFSQRMKRASLAY